MLSGTADPKALRVGAPNLTDLVGEAVVLDGVETLQVICETAAGEAQNLLPPALHPTLPGLLSWTVQKVPESPWGSFQLAQTRLQCRSGVRPRGFLCSARVDNEAAAAALEARWGFRVGLGRVALSRRYDEIGASVGAVESPILEVALRDPEPLGADYIQYVAGMHLAQTERGLRLVQVDCEYQPERSERGTPVVGEFDPAAWGAGTLQPEYPVSASFTVGSMTLPTLRFLCRPGVWAFDGTEAL